MKISFILPSLASTLIQTPSGGFRIVYEYADRLAERGHDVVIYHSELFPGVNYPTKQLLPIMEYCQARQWPQDVLPTWFTFHNSVKCLVIPEASNQYIRDGEIICATAWFSAYSVSELAKTKGSKFYLIQGYEASGTGSDSEVVKKTYQLGLKIIVISLWLKQILETLQIPVTAYIPNGLNFNLFNMVTPISSRNPLTVAMTYHSYFMKGSSDGLDALTLVKNTYPELQVTFFSVEQRPQTLPDWINFRHNVPQAELHHIYNANAIFISSSWQEGFGLPGAEAMACGCALVTTDSGGVRNYALHRQTALISPPRDSATLAKHILYLIQNNNERIKLAQSGHDYIQHFSWDRAVNEIEKVFQLM